MQPKAKQFSFEQKKDADEVVEKVRQREEINFTFQLNAGKSG